jgi:hypothetical protein
VAWFALAMPACSGGGGGHDVPQGTVSPAPAASNAPATLVVSGTFAGQAPTLLSPSRPGNGARTAARGRLASPAFDHIEVTGTLFPGDAAPYTISNAVSIPPPTNGTYAATVAFSNAVAHDNEWVVLDFAGVASNGSTIELGQLGGIVDVSGTSATSASLTPATTQTLQVFLALLQAGTLSTYDLDHSPSLASTLASDIGATGAKADASTGLYDAPALVAIYDAVEPKFERDITIATSPATAGSVTIVQDYTNAEELNLVNDGQLFYGPSLAQGGASAYELATQFPAAGTIIGANTCGEVEAGAATADPANVPVAPSLVDACIVPTTAGTTAIKGVYGGHIIVGATNVSYVSGAAPPSAFTGGTTRVAGETRGSFKTTVDVASTQTTYTVNDPAGFAFGADSGVDFSSAFYATPFVPSGLLSSTAFELGSDSATPVVVPSTYSSTNDQIVVDTFNPFDLPAADYEICGGISCYPESTPASETLTIERPFEDLGSDLSYFDWKSSGSIKAITEPGGKGAPYALDFRASGTGTITSSTPSYISPREQLALAGSTFPDGTLVTLSVTGTSGAAYSAAAVTSEGTATLSMLSVEQLVATKTITLSFKVPASGTYAFGSLYDASDGAYTSPERRPAGPHSSYR